MNQPIVQNAAKPQEVRQAGSVESLLRKQELDDFRAVVATDAGRRFMWRLLDLAGVFRTSFTGNSETFFREGQRNMGLLILADMNEACPEAYLDMIKAQKRARDEVRQQAQQKTKQQQHNRSR